MRTLVIDCSTPACSVALFEGDVLLGGHHEILGRGHAERLIPMIAQLPGHGRADRLCVGRGPGSFTGVRVAIATARALAFAWGARIEGFPTLALVAAMAREIAGAAPVGVAMTGGHGEWFTEGFDAHGRTSTQLASLKPAEAATVLDQSCIAGTEAEALVAKRESGKAMVLLPDARCFPALPATSLSDHVDPIYGRGPDARPQHPAT